MIQQAQIIDIVLLTVGLVLTLMPEKPGQTPAVVVGEVEWACETNMQGSPPDWARVQCRYWQLWPASGDRQRVNDA